MQFPCTVRLVCYNLCSSHTRPQLESKIIVFFILNRLEYLLLGVFGGEGKGEGKGGGEGGEGGRGRG